MILRLPNDAMVLLIGASGAGKTTFAARHFLPTEVLSSDEMRAMVADDPHDQAATEAAFELLHTALTLRLARRRLTAIARRLRRPAAAIVLDLPLETCLAHNATRDVPRREAAIRRQHRSLRDSIRFLAGESYAVVCTLTAEDEVDGLRIERAPLPEGAG